MMRHGFKRGFTLAEVAVAAALVAMLAAVTSPYLVSFLDRQRAQKTADKLASIATGIGTFHALVLQGGVNTGAYPGFVSQLDTLITATSVASHNSCGSANVAANQFTAAAVTAWSTYGPFVTFYLPKTGLQTPLGIVQDSMVRSNTNGTVGTLAIEMLNADSADAVMLDRVVDGGDGGLTGILRYTITSSLAHIQYLVPVGAKC